MRWSFVLPPTALVLALSLAPLLGFGGPKARPGVAIWDTGRPAPAVLPLAKNDWTSIPLDKTVDAFQGDVVLNNGRIVAV